MSQRYPTLVDRLLRQQALEVLEVYRDGPRYWVGRVKRDRQELILKAVIRDEPWYSPASGDEFRPSDQLRAEILVLEQLLSHAGSLTGGVPGVVRRLLEPQTWILRTILNGRDMAGGPGSFVYHPDFYQQRVAEALIDYVLSYQQLTSHLTAVAKAAPHTNQTDLGSKIMAADLTRPTGLLEPYAPAARAYLMPLVTIHDNQIDTLSHGELYPPHLIVDNKGQINLIDWENASLNHRLYDFVSVWIRGFDNPSWQRWFGQRLKERGIIVEDRDVELWRTEVLVQSCRYLSYLYWSQMETPHEKKLAIASLQRNIEVVLAGKGVDGL